MDLGKPVTGVFNIVKPPPRTGGDSAYLGNGYWRGADNSANSKYDEVNQFQVGRGNTATKIDEQGIWFGGNKFNNARVRISQEGNFVFNDGKFDRILIGEQK
jgi:hypothetical protein